MLLDTPIPPTGRLPASSSTERLTAIARSGFLRVGVPSRWGGYGGDLNDLFHDDTARQWLRTLHYADQLIFRSQRMVVEALVQTDNVGLRELLLPDLLSAEVGGAFAVECPCLEAQPSGLGWRFNGRLIGVPNLQWQGFSLLLPVQVDGQIEGLLLVRSEENGVMVQPDDTHDLWRQAACGSVFFQKVFLRADEWLGDQPMWQTLTETHRALRNGVSALISR